MFKRCQLKIASGLRRFRGETGGIAMIEFAAIVPLLLLMMLGTFEAGRSIMVHKRFQRATAMVGDLVAREETLGDTNAEAAQSLAGIIRAAEHVMWPYNATPLKIGVMSIRANNNDAANTTVEWAYAHNGKSVTQCPGPKALPSQGMVTAGNTAILVESEYLYTPLLLNVIPGFSNARTFYDRVVNSPRRSCVNYTGTQCTGGCP